MYEYLSRVYGGVRYGGFHETTVPDIPSNYSVFTTCRDPLERTVAVWNSLLFPEKYRDYFLKLIGDDSFSSFVRYITSFPNDQKIKGTGSPVLSSQSAWLSGVQLDYIVPIESIDDSITALPFAKKIDRVPRLLHRKHNTFCDMELESDLKQRLFDWLAPDYDFCNRSVSV